MFEEGNRMEAQIIERSSDKSEEKEPVLPFPCWSFPFKNRNRTRNSEKKENKNNK